MSAPIEPAKYTVYFDDTCPLCRRFARGIQRLDRHHATQLVPLGAAESGAVGLPADMDACRREIHIVTPDGRVLRGWDAVATVARLFPVTYFIGAVGMWPGLRQLGRWSYRQVAKRRHLSCSPRSGRDGNEAR
jgi:predicted DCC family thiol-disulfide oxidoreductase YuxK